MDVSRTLRSRYLFAPLVAVMGFAGSAMPARAGLLVTTLVDDEPGASPVPTVPLRTLPALTGYRAPRDLQEEPKEPDAEMASVRPPLQALLLTLLIPPPQFMQTTP